ncbi:MAG: sugar transferase [Dehalococcoidia bacterium]
MAKRYLDLVVSVLGLAWLWPLLVVLGLLLKLASPGSALFRQRRIGYRGRPFNCYKLRTMRAGPPQPSPHIEDWRAYVFNPPRRDPRVTAIGRALRVTGADELPQLLNVARGEMSLVGPRPELPELVAQYPPLYRRRHLVRPGITGLAQVNGRADLTYHQTMLYDLDYVEHHPFLRDIAILARTLLVALRRQGAR